MANGTVALQARRTKYCTRQPCHCLLVPKLRCSSSCFAAAFQQASLAGRDNFLAMEADRALAALVAHGGEARVAAALLAALSSKSPDVRAKAAMHLDACLQQHGARLVS